MSIKTKLMTACAGVILAGGAIANADLVIDMRLNEGGGKVLERQLVANELIKIDIYAIVSGKQAGYARTPIVDDFGDPIGWDYEYDYADGIQSISGSVILEASEVGHAVGAGTIVGTGGLPGAVAGHAAWAALGATKGVAQDLNGDGISDLGAPNGTSSDQAGNYINLRAGSMKYYPADPNMNGPEELPPFDRGPDPDSREFYLGSIRIKVGTPAQGVGATLVNWALRRDANGNVEANAALWEEDRLPAGADKEADPLNGTTGVLRVGDPVVLGIVPEPMSLSVFGLGAALLGLRRNRR